MVHHAFLCRKFRRITSIHKIICRSCSRRVPRRTKNFFFPKMVLNYFQAMYGWDSVRIFPPVYFSIRGTTFVNWPFLENRCLSLCLISKVSLYGLKLPLQFTRLWIECLIFRICRKILHCLKYQAHIATHFQLNEDQSRLNHDFFFGLVRFFHEKRALYDSRWDEPLVGKPGPGGICRAGQNT